MEVAVVILGLLVVGQWIVIWRLIDRLLMQARLPALGPIRTSPPAVMPEAVDPRRKLFSVNIDS